MSINGNLYDYTDRAFFIQASIASDGPLQQISVPGKILAIWGSKGRVETGLGYWAQPRDGMSIYLPTHLSTGASLCGPFPSEHMARVFLEEIAEKADWSLLTQQDIIVAHGDLYMKELVGSARVLAMQTIAIDAAEQIVLKVIEDLQGRRDGFKHCSELQEVADLLATLRFQQPKEKQRARPRKKRGK